jgi:hypothetical protein
LHPHAHSHRYLAPGEPGRAIGKQYADLTVTWQYGHDEILVVRIDRLAKSPLKVLHRIQSSSVYCEEDYAELLAHREELWTPLVRLLRRVAIVCGSKRYR